MTHPNSVYAAALRRTAGHRTAAAGFTLIELMIAVVVIGILTAIAYPNYQDSVRKTRRSDAKAALSDMAARQEQYYADNKQYADTVAKLKVQATSPEGYYNLSITPGGTGTLATSYFLTATATGAQSSDSKCATLTLSSTSVKASTPAGNKCW